MTRPGGHTGIMRLLRRLIVPGALVAAVMVAFAGTESAATCREVAHEGARYSVCEADAARDEIRVWLMAPDGLPYGSFSRLRDALSGNGKRLGFAMNGGMYHGDLAPVGLYIEDGAQVSPATLGGGYGNFGMRPNGVFCVLDGRAAVIETQTYMDAPPGCRHATQSGPMLVIGGALHPSFSARSDSRRIRNGVGVAPDGRRVVFAISETPVTLYAFAAFFRDVLKTPDALYLDGNISKLYAPELERADAGRAMGPILGVVRGPE